MDRRRARLATTVVVALATLLTACGSPDERAEDTPGFSDRGRTLDTTPFQMAQPSTTAGPTTIPGGPFDPSDPDRATRDGDSTTTTTSTTLPDQVPAPHSDALACLGFYEVADVVREGQKMFEANVRSPGSVSYPTVRTMFLEGLARAAAVLASRISDQRVTDVPTALLRRVRATYDFAGTTTSFEQGGELLYPLVGAPPEAGEPVGWPEIEAVLAAECPELLMALTGESTLE